HMNRKKNRVAHIYNTHNIHLEVECVTQLRKTEHKLDSLGSVLDITPVLADVSRKKAENRAAKPASGSVEVEVESVIQLRRFGDKLNFCQKLLDLISKLFSLVT
uniref:Uncharacterized protein n=1 Tax=Sciurus vulgaris TaxID=55149 RepID=A0A8D2CT29_SCIVU